MPATRFTKVSPPFETRVSDSLFVQLQNVVGFGLRLHDQFNETVHDQEFATRTTHAVVDALRPGSLPFLLLVVAAAAFTLHALVVLRDTNRILRDHGHFLQPEKDDSNGKAHVD